MSDQDREIVVDQNAVYRVRRLDLVKISSIFETMVVTIHEAKTHLSRLIHKVEEGEEIIVCRGKHPVARLVPASTVKAHRPPVGVPTSDTFKIPADAFAPMTDEELKDWVA